MRAHLKLDGLKRYGRRGQRQHGIDLIDLESPPPLVGIQCKAEGLEEVFTEKRLRDLVALALTAPFKLKRYIVLCTSKTSTELQIAISQINAEHAEKGQFIVEFKGWEEIERLNDDYPEVAQDKLSIVRNAQLTAINENLSDISTGITVIKETISSNEFDTEISLAKDGIERRDFPLSKSRLSRLRRDKWEKLNDDQRFLVLANLGHIESAKNLIKEAAALMLQAVPYANGSVKGREVEAQAYLLRGDHKKAYEISSALRIEHPESWRATMLMLYSAPPEVSFDDLRSAMTDADLLHQEVLAGLAARAQSSQLFLVGQDYARQAIESSDIDWPFPKIILAQCISHSVLLGSGSKPVEGFTASDRKKLKEADVLFEQSVSGAKDRQEYPLAAQALIERAGIAERLDDENTARTLVEEAYRIAPEDPNAKSGYATLLQRLGDIDRAISLTEELAKDPGGSGFKRQLAEMLLKRDRAADAGRIVDLLKEICLTTEPLTPHYRYGVLIETLVVLARAGRISEGRALIDDAPAGSLSTTAQFALTARLFWHMGDEVTAKSHLLAATHTLSDASVETEVEMIAATFTSIGEYRQALPLWRRIFGVHNPLAIRQAITVARRLGLHADVLAMCRELREAGVEDETTVQIEADLLQDDDFEGAIAILQAFLTNHPENAVVRLRISHMAIERGRTDLLQSPSDALPDVETIQPYFARAVTYFLKYSKRTDEALKYGYDVLHRHFEDVDAHRAFMLLFVPLGPPLEISTPETVMPGTAVEYIEHGTVPRWHVIEDQLKPDARLKEFDPSHSISQALLGRAVGETIELAPGRISSRKATIQKILSKYVYRFQCCVDELQLRFPEVTDMQTMHLPRTTDGELDLSELKATLERQFQGRKQAIEAYSDQQLPLHFVGTILGESSFEAVLHLANDPKSIVRCAPSNFQTRQEASFALVAASEIVLDLSSIATLVLTESTDFVAKLNLPIIISQSCADELDRISGKTGDGTPRSGLRFGWYENQIVAVEVSEEVLIEREKQLSEQIGTIRALARVEPCRELSEMPEEAKAPLIQLFGRYGVQTILLAKKPGRVLWCDDFVQSSIAINEYGVRTVWSEIVAGHLELRGTLSKSDSVTFVAKLLGFRYESMAISPSILVEAARQADWSLEARSFKCALEPLASVPLNDQFFNIVGGIATAIDREIGDGPRKAQLVKAVLETVSRRPDGIRIFFLMSQLLQRVPFGWREEWFAAMNDIIGRLYDDWTPPLAPDDPA